MDAASGHVDAAFPLLGREIPLDHGYLLFSALVGVLPGLRGTPGWGLHPVAGRVLGEGRLALHRRSYLKIRRSKNELAELLALPGKVLRVGQAQLRVGAPRIYGLERSATLRARFVTIKNALEAEPFVSAVRQQLAGIEGLGQDPERIEITLGRRRVMRVRGDRVVGFGLALSGLEEQASLRIQETGLGGRRRLGGGIFVPPAMRERR